MPATCDSSDARRRATSATTSRTGSPEPITSPARPARPSPRRSRAARDPDRPTSGHHAAGSESSSRARSVQKSSAPSSRTTPAGVGESERSTTRASSVPFHRLRSRLDRDVVRGGSGGGEGPLGGPEGHPSGARPAAGEAEARVGTLLAHRGHVLDPSPPARAGTAPGCPPRRGPGARAPRRGRATAPRRTQRRRPRARAPGRTDTTVRRRDPRAPGGRGPTDPSSIVSPAAMRWPPKRSRCPAADPSPSCRS